ncbi:hypothetical protein GCM10007420_22090 [Glycocaulis albus]|uniref:Lipoprotein n=2 Tax=Glycocaulis albus TaxID=1382801 RepID=A0ABQ1XWH5_9PROT|nr:hypothetical protein GCM10007420_22090 [Glycocaulis albus]
MSRAASLKLGITGVVCVLIVGCATTPEDCDPTQPGIGRALGCTQSGAYDARVDALRSQRAGAMAENYELSNQRAGRAGEIRALAAERSRLVQENASLRSANAAMRAQVTQLQSRAGVSASTLNQVDEQLRTLEAERSELETLLLGDDPTINQRLAELNRQLDNLRQRNRALVRLISEAGG